MAPRCRFGLVALGVTSLVLLSISVVVQTATAASTGRNEKADEIEVLDLLKEWIENEVEKKKSERKPLRFWDDAVSCGVPSVEPNMKKISISRIVGGSVAIPNSWPWQVSVQFFDGENGFGHGCGGSVLADSNYILTAAHCVVDEKNKVTPPKEVQVIAGIFAQDDTSAGQLRSVIKVIPHENYNTATHDNDVALLQLSEPLEFNANVTPVCLASADTESPVGTMCTVTGWGTTSSGGVMSNVLNQVGVPVYCHTTCNSNYNGEITDNMICAGFSEGLKDSCQGDSGGPLVCPVGNGTWILNGVVSFGNACAKPDAPGIYARVSNYINWLAENGVQNIN